MAVSYVIAGGFIAGWIGTAWTARRSGWDVLHPWLYRWLVVEAAQAIAVTAGGPYPPAWWGWWIWMPLEVLALIALGLAVGRIVPSFLAILAVTIAAPLSLALVRVGSGPVLFQLFLLYREACWILLAVTLSAWLSLQVAIPRRLGARGVYTVAWLLALHLWSHVLLAPIMAETRIEWLSARSVFRCLTIFICWRWSAVFRRFPLGYATGVESGRMVGTGGCPPSSGFGFESGGMVGTGGPVPGTTSASVVPHAHSSIRAAL